MEFYGAHPERPGVPNMGYMYS